MNSLGRLADDAKASSPVSANPERTLIRIALRPEQQCGLASRQVTSAGFINAE